MTDVDDSITTNGGPPAAAVPKAARFAPFTVRTRRRPPFSARHNPLLWALLRNRRWRIPFWLSFWALCGEWWAHLAEFPGSRQEGLAATTLTGGEETVVGNAVQIAQRRLDRLSRRLERRAHEVRKLTGRIGRVNARIYRIVERLWPSAEAGGKRLPELEATHKKLLDQLSDESKKSHRHDRVGRGMRLFPRFACVMGFAIGLWFMGWVCNVKWSAPGTTPGNLAAAILLAAFMELGTYLALTNAGRLLRKHRRDDGHLELRGLPFPTKLVVGLAVAAMAVVAAFMFDRIYEEVTTSFGGSGRTTAVLLATAFTVLSVAINVMVIHVAAHDGSELTQKIDAYHQAMYKPARRIRLLSVWRGYLRFWVDVLFGRVERRKARREDRAERPLRRVEQIITKARTATRARGLLAPVGAGPGGAIGYGAFAERVTRRGVETAWTHIVEARDKAMDDDYLPSKPANEKRDAESGENKS